MTSVNKGEIRVKFDYEFYPDKLPYRESPVCFSGESLVCL